MAESLTLTVTPAHLKSQWKLVYEFHKETGTLLTLSPMVAEQAAQMPTETATSDFVVKALGNVLAREAGGCFAPNKKQAVLTFNENGRITRVA